MRASQSASDSSVARGPAASAPRGQLLEREGLAQRRRGAARRPRARARAPCRSRGRPAPACRHPAGGCGGRSRSRPALGHRRHAVGGGRRAALVQPGRRDGGVDPGGGEVVGAAGPPPSASGTGWRCRGGARRWADCRCAGGPSLELTASVKFAWMLEEPVVDPRTPVLIGAGQLSNRVDKGATAARAGRPDRRGAPAGRRGQRRRRRPRSTGADAVHIVGLLSWRYRDPGRLVAERVGADPRTTTVTGMGGNSPQSLVNLACLAILAGEADLVLLGGAEAWRTRMGARRRASSSTGPCRATTCPRPTKSIAEVPDVGAGRAGPRRGRCRCRCTRCSSRPTASSSGAASTSTSSRCPSCGPGSARWRPTNPHAWIQEALHARGDPHADRRQPDDRLPVHEADELQQRRRAGRRR